MKRSLVRGSSVRITEMSDIETFNDIVELERLVTYQAVLQKHAKDLRAVTQATDERIRVLRARLRGKAKELTGKDIANAGEIAK